MRLVALFSERCFHCVDYDVLTGSDQALDRALSVVGTVCPLCPEVIQKGDVAIVMDSDDVKQIAQGTSMWNRGAVTSSMSCGHSC